MMRLFTSSAIVFIVASVFISCEEPFDFAIDEEERLVVISNFTNDFDLVVIVSKTKSVLSQNPAEFVNDASVMVFSGSELLEVLELIPANETKRSYPFYHSKSIKLEIGKTYTIKVSAPGFAPVTATNIIPVAVPIESVQFSNSIIDNFNNSASIDFEITMTYIDPSDIQNYYHIIFYQQLLPYSLTVEGDTLFHEPEISIPINIESKDLNLPLLKYYDNKSFLLKDQAINGQKVTMTFKGSYSYDKTNYIPSQFFVELRTVSEAYYLYHSTLTRQISSDHPLSEGVVIYDNIENGEGIFAGYSSNTNSFRLNN